MGAISHMNYAQKVAQMPMVLSLMICTVTFPVVAQAMAAGDREKARLRVERDLGLAGTVVLLGTAVVLGYAPQIIEVLFQRGAFDAADTASTAQVMRVYALGLLGHCLVGALKPAVLLVRAAHLVPGVRHGHRAAGHDGGRVRPDVPLRRGRHRDRQRDRDQHDGVAAPHGPGHPGGADPDAGRGALAGPTTGASLVAGAAGWACAPLVPDPVLSLAAGCLLVPSAFFLTGLALRSPEVVSLLALTRRRFLDGR